MLKLLCSFQLSCMLYCISCRPCHTTKGRTLWLVFTHCLWACSSFPSLIRSWVFFTLSGTVKMCFRFSWAAASCRQTHNNTVSNTIRRLLQHLTYIPNPTRIPATPLNSMAQYGILHITLSVTVWTENVIKMSGHPMPPQTAHKTVSLLLVEHRLFSPSENVTRAALCLNSSLLRAKYTVILSSALVHNVPQGSLQVFVKSSKCFTSHGHITCLT